MTDFIHETNKSTPIYHASYKDSSKPRGLKKTVSFSLKNEEFCSVYQEPEFIESNLEFTIQDREVAFIGKGNSSSCVSFENFDKSSQGTAMDTEFNNELIQERVEPAAFSMDEVIYRLLALQAHKALEENISEAMERLDVVPREVLMEEHKS
jgi:hypothetical protein